MFPKPSKLSPLQSLEEIIEHINDNRREHIVYLVEDISEYVFQRATLEGFHITDEDHIKSSMLFIESLRALLYKTADLDHPLHKIAEEVITSNTTEEGGLSGN